MVKKLWLWDKYQRVWKDFSGEKSLIGRGCADFLATPPPLVPVWHLVASGTVIHTTIIACQGVWECCARSRMVAGHRAGGVEGVQ